MMGKNDKDADEIESLLMAHEDHGNVKLLRCAVTSIPRVVDFFENQGYILRAAFNTPTFQINLVFKKRAEKQA